MMTIIINGVEVVLQAGTYKRIQKIALEKNISFPKRYFF